MTVACSCGSEMEGETRCSAFVKETQHGVPFGVPLNLWASPVDFQFRRSLLRCAAACQRPRQCSKIPSRIGRGWCGMGLLFFSPPPALVPERVGHLLSCDFSFLRATLIIFVPLAMTVGGVLNCNADMSWICHNNGCSFWSWYPVVRFVSGQAKRKTTMRMCWGCPP